MQDSHLLPVYPGGQAQLNPPAPLFKHWPKLRHGFGVHAKIQFNCMRSLNYFLTKKCLQSTLMSQLVPWKLGGHLHVYPPAPLLAHCAEFKQLYILNIN